MRCQACCRRSIQGSGLSLCDAGRRWSGHRGHGRPDGKRHVCAGFSGAVIDGGIRDIPQLKRIGFPVYSTGPVPSTSVGIIALPGLTFRGLRWCDGEAGDIIVADQDGVVVVPQEHAAEILIRHSNSITLSTPLYPFIEKFHSITEAVRQFGRI